jgi:hypothetical protein
VQGVGGWFAQGAGEQDSTVGLMGQFDESGQAASEARDSTGGIQDQQASVHEANEGGQLIQVVGQSKRGGASQWTRSILDEGTEEQHMGGIASGSFEARFEGIGGRVRGGEEDDVALLDGRAVGKGGAAGDAGGQGEGQEGESTSGGGIEQGEVTKGDATGPQPAQGLAGDVREQEDSGWEGSRRAGRRGRGAWEGGGGGGIGAVEGAFEFVQEVVIDGFEGHGGGPFRGSEGG